MQHRWDGEDLILESSIQARSKEDKVIGSVGNFLKIKVTAPPINDKASKHLAQFFA
jgi:uncharacterized protein YggU (UPF0235/DUF167 family)